MAKEKNKPFKLKYVGTSPSAEVPHLGVFPFDEVISFEDPEKVDQAKELVKTNVNFEGVE